APITNGVSTGPSSQSRTIATAAIRDQLRMRRCDEVRPIEGPAGSGCRRQSMQARRVAVTELEQALVDGEAVAPVRHVLEVAREIGDSGLHRAQLRCRKAAVAPLLPRVGQEDDEALRHGVQAGPVLGAAGGFLWVWPHR